MEPNEVQVKLINIFEERFKRLADLDAPKSVLTTADIFYKFQSIWPSEEYNSYDVYQVLTYLNIDGVQGESDKFYWLLQE